MNNETGSISMQKLMCLSDYSIQDPFLEKYFSENWSRFLILIIKKLTHVFNFTGKMK